MESPTADEIVEMIFEALSCIGITSDSSAVPWQMSVVVYSGVYVICKNSVLHSPVSHLRCYLESISSGCLTEKRYTLYE